MSRLSARLLDGSGTVVYGLDRQFGWFYEEYPNNSDEPTVVFGFPDPAISKGDLLERLEKTDADYAFRMRIALDLDPAL